jgi:Fe-S-cluster containining protein
LRTEEVRRLAHLSGLPRQRFLDIKTFSLKGKRLLSFPCHFYDRQSKSCRIYKYRPAACGQFPINTPMAFVGTGIPLEGVLMLLANPRCPGAKPVMKLLLQAIPRMYNREAKLPPETQQLLTEARLLRLSNIREEQTHMTIESVEGLRGQER